jgi:hypothetical protein
MRVSLSFASLTVGKVANGANSRIPYSIYDHDSLALANFLHRQSRLL